jgi:hypothetical protein
LARLIALVLLVPALGYVGYLAIALGPELAKLEWGDLARGYHHVLMPAERRGPVLRSSQGGSDRIYMLTTQSERLVPLRLRSVGNMRARQMLHVDLWAFDPATAQPSWRRRLRSYEDRGDLMHTILGADASTLWLFIREPLAVSLADGAILADGARLEALNPALAGQRVDQAGFVAFGAQGLQLTLSDSTQWAVDGKTLRAQPRAAAPRHDDRLTVPAYDASYTSSLQLRGVPLGSMWLGVLTDSEAETLRAPPVVPGAKPGDRRGAMADFLESQHVPGRLDTAPTRYRLWSAKLTKVSAAPRDWPKELPNNWGTRDQFSDYAPLAEAPVFLQAGLLGNGKADIPFWYRDPDSVLVLHHDKVGEDGRLRVARVSGPKGRVVWDAALGIAELDSALYGPSAIGFVGRLPNPAHDPHSDRSRDTHELLVSVTAPDGAVSTYDLTAESVTDRYPATAAEGPE